ncbi:MAG: alpha/beta fold hydrolase [Desulfuromonadales bacterium]|nr:alpha/beta fold hydrolase [Desulfuromonadales bacterium]
MRSNPGHRPLAELVSTRTDDGVLLHGALFESEPHGVTAVLIVHGGWGNFYTGLGRFLPAALVADGIACLSLNNRGHDYGTFADGERCIGLLREQFKDSPKDIEAGLRLLKQRGYRRLVLVGHSYGASKAAYSQILEPDPDVMGMILCSPAALMRDVWKYYLDIPYEEAVREAQGMVEAGQGEKFVIFRHRGPAPIICTAQTFLSVWGPNPGPDLCKFIGEWNRPLLVTVCQGDRICRDYSRVVYEHAGNAEPRELALLAGGNHDYHRAEESLEQVLLTWLGRCGLK